MIRSDVVHPRAERQALLDRITWLAVYTIVVGVGLAVGLFAYRRSFQTYMGPALGALVFVTAGWFYRPRATLYATVFFALVGDLVTVSWFPFTKNLSSIESILYIGDGVSVSPLEIVLLTGIAVTVVRGIADPAARLSLGALGRPLLIFDFFLLFGLVNGLASGGDFRAAMFEFRPLVYLSLMYWLVTTYCTHDRHRRHLMFAAVWGVFFQSLLSLRYVRALPASQRDSLDSLTEHGSALGMNLVLLVFLTSLAYRRVSGWQRLGLFAMSVPIVWVSILSQRRAGFLTLAAGGILLAICLFWRQRGTFWRFVPIVTLIALGYVGAFWNTTSSIGVPAQAVKGVVAPEQLAEVDQASDAYRIIENLDVHATVQSAPVTGIGFGQPFLRPIALPDISSFEFNAYMPHNSFLWIWIKTGFFGFFAMVYVVGRAVSMGAHRLRHIPDGPDAVVASVSLFFIVMYMIYTYVDIAWDSRNMVLLGTVLSIATAGVPIRRAASASQRDSTSGGSSARRRVPAPG